MCKAFDVRSMPLSKNASKENIIRVSPRIKTSRTVRIVSLSRFTIFPDELGRQESVTNGVATSVFACDPAILAPDTETTS